MGVSQVKWHSRLIMNLDQTLVTSFFCVFLGFVLFCLIVFNPLPPSKIWLLTSYPVQNGLWLVLIYQSQILLSNYYMCDWSLCLIKVFWCECFCPTSLGCPLPWPAWRVRRPEGLFVICLSYWRPWFKLRPQWEGDLIETFFKLIPCTGVRTRDFVSRAWCMGVLNFERRLRDFHVRSSNKIAIEAILWKR